MKRAGFCLSALIFFFFDFLLRACGWRQLLRSLANLSLRLTDANRARSIVPAGASTSHETAWNA